jgi:5-(carboxyamino)imidazole ribonucleotide mutase
MTKPVIGVVMGSDSDLPAMKDAVAVLREFEIPHEVNVLSAHRTPGDMAIYGNEALARGLKIIIAGAGGAAHLPGMLAAHTPLPVIGVPVKSSALNGLDSLLSIVQMPGGVPVATVAIGKSKNAGLLAVKMLAIHDTDLLKKLREYEENMADMSRRKNDTLHDKLNDLIDNADA